MKKLIIDLRTVGAFGSASKAVEIIHGYLNLGYDVELVAKDWSEEGKRGVVFDKNIKQFTKGTSKQLYDPNTHPDDFIENLILPTFDKIEYVKNSINYKSINIINEFFNSYYVTYRDIITMFMEPEELKRYKYLHQGSLPLLNKKEEKTTNVNRAILRKYFAIPNTIVSE